MKRKILCLSANKLEIEHIGSTAVKSLGGKGIIDISIGIKKWKDADEIIKILKKIGFNRALNPRA
ncbi:MAG: GrpB family protein [Candidatus Moranbacteria bacterium]|nr:GrpB family protein [Candidatus Moranbacteria bacterium]